MTLLCEKCGGQVHYNFGEPICLQCGARYDIILVMQHTRKPTEKEAKIDRRLGPRLQTGVHKIL